MTTAAKLQHLAEEIRVDFVQVRKARRLALADVAPFVGLSASTLSRYERGLRGNQMTIGQLFRILNWIESHNT